MVYTIDGKNYYSIQDFSRMCKREVSTIRHLLFDGNMVRKMKYIRDGSRIFIPVEEYYGFPHVNGGLQQYGQDVYHYNERGERLLCKACSYSTEWCEARKKAEAWS